jgi:hypothetical protein
LKICILSGPYAPQKCGISDYIELLINELNKRNIECIHTIIDQNNPLSNIAANLPNADLYSFQFAPYMISSTGFSGQNLYKLGKSLNNRNLHINFHEIWIGAYNGASYKEKLIGYLQKKDIHRFLSYSKPNVITASNSAAIDRLKKAKINAEYLYLCGTIPLFPKKKELIKKSLKVAFFGTVYSKFPYNQLGRNLKKISATSGKPINVEVIGRQRESVGLKALKKISELCGFKFSVTNQLSREQVSTRIQNCDIGISTTPYDIIGKSSATASFLEHRLPVLTYDDGDTHPSSLFVMSEFEDQIFLLGDQKLDQRLIAFMQKPRMKFFDGVVYTANNMERFCI